MKHMRTGRIRRNGVPLFYIKDTATGYTVSKPCKLEKAIEKADAIGLHAHVFKLGTCTNPVHIGTYE